MLTDNWGTDLLRDVSLKAAVVPPLVDWGISRV